MVSLWSKSKSAFLVFSCLVQFIATEEELRELAKCCYKGEQLDYNAKRCVSDPGLKVSRLKHEFLNPVNKETTSWYPDFYLNKSFSVIVNYGMLHKTRYDIIADRAYDSELQFRGFDGTLGKFINSIKQKFLCYDKTENPSRPRTELIGVEFTSIHKCCSKYQQLNAKASACVTAAGINEEIDQEIIYDNRFPNGLNWLMLNTTNRIVKVDYNLIKRGYNLNEIFQESSDIMYLSFTESVFMNSSIYFIGRNGFGNVVKGETDAFCFDSVEEGPLAPRVLLTATYDLYKCCAKGEQIDLLMDGCVARSHVKTDAMENELISRKVNDSTVSWIPSFVNYSSASVRYNAIDAILNLNKKRTLFQTVVLDRDVYELYKERNGSLSFFINISLMSGKSFSVATQHFCFDTIDDSVNVVMIRGFPEIWNLKRCCYPGQALTKDGRCEKHDGLIWSMGISELRKLNISRNSPLFFSSVPSIAICYHNSFKVVSDMKSFLLGKFNIEKDTGNFRSFRSHCFDFLVGPSSQKKEVLASCVLLPTASEYRAVRPLGVVSTLLFVTAAVVVVAREETRRTAHGRALVAHALCFAAANAVQVTWFFRPVDTEISKLLETAFHPDLSFPCCEDKKFVLGRNIETALLVTLFSMFRR